MVVGDNGILNQAVNAADSTDIADTKEQIQVALLGILIVMEITLFQMC